MLTPDQIDARVVGTLSVGVAVLTFLFIFSVFMGWIRLPPASPGCQGFDDAGAKTSVN